MKNKLKNIALISTVTCISFFAQSDPLIDSKNLDKQIDNKNTGTITIMNCSPYPICAKDVKENQTKKTQVKTKKKPK